MRRLILSAAAVAIATALPGCGTAGRKSWPEAVDHYHNAAARPHLFALP